MALFKKVDAVVVRVRDLEQGIDFYCNKLGHKLKWIKSDSAGLELGESELVLSTTLQPGTDLLVGSVEEAVTLVTSNGGRIISEPSDIPVGKVAVAEDPFGNTLTILDLSKGTHMTDIIGNIIGVGSGSKQ